MDQGCPTSAYPRSRFPSSARSRGSCTDSSGASLPAGRETREDSPARVAASLSQGAGRLLLMKQVHGSRVLCAPWEGTPEADAATAREAGWILGVETADCLPVLLVDPAAAARWRRSTRVGAGPPRASRARAVEALVAARLAAPGSRGGPGPGDRPLLLRGRGRAAARPSGPGAELLPARSARASPPRRASRQPAAASGGGPRPGTDPRRRRMHVLPGRPLPLLPPRRSGRRSHDQLRGLPALGAAFTPASTPSRPGRGWPGGRPRGSARGGRGRGARPRSGASRTRASRWSGTHVGVLHLVASRRSGAPPAPSRRRRATRAGAPRERVAQRVEQGLVLGHVVGGAAQVAVELGDLGPRRASATWTPKPASPGLPRLRAVDVDVERAAAAALGHGSGSERRGPAGS